MADENIEITVNDAEVRQAIRRFGEEAGDGRPVFKDLFVWWKFKTLQSWERIKATGGTFRGKDRWPKFADQRPGVPAWGGTQKKRGRGLTRGRKRPSGQRITQSSTQLQDRKRLRGTLSRPIRITKEFLRIGTNLIYGEKVTEKGRNPIKWVPEDDKKFADLVRAYWASLARKHGFTSR